MDGVILIIVTYALIAIILITITIVVIKKKRSGNFKRTIEQLDKEKNMIESTPILLELAKVETIIKNDKMEEKYKQWQERFENIKNNQIAHITDMIIDLDIFIGNKDYTGYQEKLHGGIFVDRVVVYDQNIITSQGPATPYPFAFQIIEALGKDTTEMKERLMYNFAGGKS